MFCNIEDHPTATTPSPLRAGLLQRKKIMRKLRRCLLISKSPPKDTDIREKCRKWSEEIEGLAAIALHEPQLAYCAFTQVGSSRRWSFQMRTTPNILHLLAPIEEKIRHTLIPYITGNMCQSEDERALVALPARLGGLAFMNPLEVADNENSHSLLANKQLTDSMLRQHVTYVSNHDDDTATKKIISLANNKSYGKIQGHLQASLPESISKMIVYAIEKGASTSTGKFRLCPQ